MILDGREVGPGRPTFIIAELSANHQGSLDRALEIVRAAASSGADAVKLQTYRADTLTIDCDNDWFRLGDHPLWGGRTLYQLYDEAHTPWQWHGDLKAEAERLGLAFFSTPFDETAVDFLESLGVGFYKIASFELVDIPLLRRVARTGKPVIMSVGMATRDEIALAVRTLRDGGAGEVALLKCTSAYPAAPDEMNLRTIADLAESFGVVAGLSDHTTGTAVAVASVALGACIIEKHLTLSRADGGPDAAFSLEPAEFAALVRDVRVAEQALGRVSYGPTTGEKANARFRRSIFAVADIAAGEEISAENIRIIRPGDGLAPVHYDDLLGRRAAADIPRGTPLRWDLLQNGAAAAPITLRPATGADVDLIFAWANDPETRRQSFSTAAIEYAGHCRWFAARLASPTTLFLIAEDSSGKPVGTIRFDCDDEGVGLISFSVAPDARGHGYGLAVLAEGSREALSSGFTQRVRGLVRLTNRASLRCFEKAGFARRSDAAVNDTPCAVFELDRPQGDQP